MLHFTDELKPQIDIYKQRSVFRLPTEPCSLSFLAFEIANTCIIHKENVVLKVGNICALF